MKNLDKYNSLESATPVINQDGIDELKNIVENKANFEWFGDDKQIEALAWNDEGFDDDGFMHLELRGAHTKSGNPHNYTLDIEEHFDVIISDE